MNGHLRGRFMAAIAAIALAGCSAAGTQSAAGIRRHVLPTFRFQCRSAESGARTTASVPIRVIRSGAGAEVVAGMCIDGRGPFSFVVDTGSETSVIDVSLARHLGLVTVGKVSGSSFGCRRTLSTAYLKRWTLGRTSLKGQWVAVGAVTSRKFPNLMGLLGADVLSRFGVMRLDYSAQTLSIGPEGAPLTSSVRGGTATPQVPAHFSQGTVQVVPMVVQVAQNVPLVFSDLTLVRPKVTVTVGGQHYQFVVDTGAAVTVVSAGVVRDAGLGAPTGEGQTSAGLNCPISVSFYKVTSWSLSTLRLRPATVVSNQLPPATNGLFGSGTLEQYSPIVFDFADGAILLGPPTAS